MGVAQAAIISPGNTSQIRSRPCPSCPLCDTRGEPLYEGLRDGLFGAPGVWNLRCCAKRACGVVWLDPMPLEEDISIAYQNYFTHQELPKAHSTWLRAAYRSVQHGYLLRKFGYGSKKSLELRRLWGLLMYLHPVRRIDTEGCVMHLPARPNGRLLDVGCGNGRFLEWMADLGWGVEGVDTDPVTLEVAKSRGLQVRLGSLQSQGYTGNSFDAVTLNHVIEHVHHPLSLVSECHRVLRPGGLLAIITPNIKSLGHVLFKANWRGLEPPRHLHIFSPESLLNLTERTGFRVRTLLTSIRAAKAWSRQSLRIASLDPDPHSAAASIPTRVRAWGAQLLEYSLAKVQRDAGEEIILVTEKQ